MPCDFVALPDGGAAIVCTGGRRRRCAFCDASSTKLCDGPPPEGKRRKTCDRPLCPRHAAHVDGQDLDFCPEHRGLAGGQEDRPARADAAPAGSAPSPAGSPPTEDQMRGGPPRPVGAVMGAALPAPAHAPKKCRSCGASIFWGRTEAGRSMPVDVGPHPEGRVVLYDRGGSVIARALKRGEEPKPGEVTRRPHHMTCPHAGAWRRR